MIDIPNPPPAERVVLAGLFQSGGDAAEAEEDLQEMRMLCVTAGAEVVEAVIQKRLRPDPATYLGRGKIEEIRRIMRHRECPSLVVDAELSPGQLRTIEKTVQGKVIDRSQLILDIFAHHARTNEARIQVELAQLRTLYPRLTHAWSHFSQQVGGIGTSGPGEKQLEVDRRLVQRKIADLKSRLRRVERSRRTQRKSRSRVFKAALVGYTNVGKSSLLNALSGSRVGVEDKLFATLDTATRRMFIQGVGELVVSDTVGLLRKLPHHLVASFRSTLEVVSRADLLLVVIDASSPWNRQQLKTVDDVLRELHAEHIPRLRIMNKVDLITDAFQRKQLQLAFPEAIFVSAHEPESLAPLKDVIGRGVAESRKGRAMDDVIARKSRELQRRQEHTETGWRP